MASPTWPKGTKQNTRNLSGYFFAASTKASLAIRASSRARRRSARYVAEVRASTITSIPVASIWASCWSNRHGKSGSATRGNFPRAISRLISRRYRSGNSWACTSSLIASSLPT